MNPTILNRDFQHPGDGWYQIEAKGEHPNRAAGVVQIIDDEATTAIVNRFNSDAQAGALRHGSELLIDHEHFSDQPDKETRAYGWLQELQNRADGIYGRIRWSATGKAAVDGGDYRFFSTEYAREDLTVINSDKGIRRIRPMRLDGLSLTNMNNNRGQKPITNRRQGAGAIDFPGSRESGASPNQKQERTNTMKSIAAKLGLAPEASEDAILGEVTKLQNRLTTLEPLEANNTTLKNRVTELEGEQCDNLLALYGVKDKAAETLKPMLATLKNRADRVTALTNLGHKLAETKPGAATKIINRADGKTPETATETTDAAEDQAKAQKIRNRANQLVAGGMKFEQAWNMARTEK